MRGRGGSVRAPTANRCAIQKGLGMIRFRFEVNKSFLDYETRPITIPKTQVDYGRIVKERLGADNVRVICPDMERLSGSIYSGVAGYGPYYQIRIDGSPSDPLRKLKCGDWLRVEVENTGTLVEVRLAKMTF